MELKYYLRGLGLGIIVTAIIMSVLTSKNQTMTDAQIIARAKQLGMIEDRVLSESAAQKENASGENASGEDVPEKNDSRDVNTSADNTQSAQDAQNGNAQDAQSQQNADAQSQQEVQDASEPGVDVSGREEEPQQQEPAESEQTFPVSDTDMVVTIGAGDGSYAVSRKLADVGAISSPGNFDTFLCENGYDKKIRPGTYMIPADASDEQMARIITGAE